MKNANYVRARTPKYKGLYKIFDNLNSYEIELYNAEFNQAVYDVLEMIENDYYYNEIYESVSNYLPN